MCAARWDVEPSASEGGEWHMKVSATRDIEAGEELLLSYGEAAPSGYFLAPVGGPLPPILGFQCASVRCKRYMNSHFDCLLLAASAALFCWAAK